MEQDLEREGRRETRRDPLSLLSHAWSVEAYNEIEALFKAMEQSTLIPEYVWRRIVEVKRIDPSLFIIHNKEVGSSIVARVTPVPERLDVVSVLLGRPSSPLRKYYVTFYPRTYTRRGKHSF